MAILTSQSIRSESETVLERPVMPIDIFIAAIKGNSDVLIPRLGLPSKEQTEIQVTIEASHSALEQIKTEYQTVQSELQSATGFGDTILHLLVTKWHNELALKVFERDMSLLKAQNKMLETPLYCAVKVGNDEVIQMFSRFNPAAVKAVLQETNENGDTALHVAVRCNFEAIIIKLMMLDPKVAYKVNNEMLTPLYVAIEEEHDSIAENMMKVDPNLAGTQFFDGTFPIHLAARKGNWLLVLHFLRNYPDYTELVDPRGRNLFHFAAEEEHGFFCTSPRDEGALEVRMNNAMDYEGNTPLHIAAMKGHRLNMRAIWKNRMTRVAETVRNKRGLTPYKVSRRQLEESTTNAIATILSRIGDYEDTYGENFSKEWFDHVMEPPMENKLERTQIIGLGSVLITTVTFAAAFTIPGGYNQDYGTPVLGRRYIFWAFILANALAFIQGFVSLFALLINALPGIPIDTFLFAMFAFLFAASSMVVAFGLGLYVTLAPVCLPIAIIVLVITLFIGSPSLLIALGMGTRYFRIATNFLSKRRSILGIYAVSLLLIFCLALLSL